MSRDTEPTPPAGFGHPVGGLLVVAATLAGCVVPVQAPYTAAPASYWAAWPAPPDFMASHVPAGHDTAVRIDPAAVYGLADLIDFAHRTNPATRQAWEQARAAAAGVARAEAAYYPTLFVLGAGGIERAAFPSPMGSFSVEGPTVRPEAQLQWILFDFGRRSSDVEHGREDLFQANFAFNRALQEVAFAVSRNYFHLDASRGRVTAARATLQAATAVEDAIRARRERGLATLPELLLAEQDHARAAFELEAALGAVADAQAALAESLGIPPTALMRVADLSAVALPTGLTDPVEQIIDRTLRRRPDLGARLAAVRAREAAERRAFAEFWPRLAFSGSADESVLWYRAAPPPARFTMNDTEYQALFKLEWTLFDGLDRENALRQARSLRGAAAADLAARELQAVREVWQACSDVKTALRKYDYARALLAASQAAYESTLESYRSAGLATVLDLLTAQRDLARARTTLIESRAELLTAFAALAFAAGDG